MQPAVQLCNLHVGVWMQCSCAMAVCADAQGRAFQHLLVAELQKVSTFYRERSTQLEVRCAVMMPSLLRVSTARVHVRAWSWSCMQGRLPPLPLPPRSSTHSLSRAVLHRPVCLQASLASLTAGPRAASPQALAALQAEVKELIKWVALNYLATVKAIKKRNKNMKVRRSRWHINKRDLNREELCTGGGGRGGVEACQVDWQRGGSWHPPARNIHTHTPT